MGAGASTRTANTKLEALEQSYHEAVECLQRVQQALEAERKNVEIKEASAYYRKHTGLKRATVSGWQSQRIKLLQGKPWYDDQFLCPSGMGKWVRKGPDEPYEYKF